MALTYGSVERVCPYCCENIKMGQSYERAVFVPDSPINGMMIHSNCARQRDFANDSLKGGR